MMNIGLLTSNSLSEFRLNTLKPILADNCFSIKIAIIDNRPEKSLKQKLKKNIKRGRISEYAKKYNQRMLKRMLNSSRNKNYELNGYKMNSIEYQIGLILNELKLNWKYESVFNFEKNCYLPDFSVESSKLIIECYGDFWHANPKYFKPNDTTHKTRTATHIWEYDKRKKEVFENDGYKYLYFWENDIIENVDKIKGLIYEEVKE